MKIVWGDAEWRIEQPEENKKELESIIEDMYGHELEYTPDFAKKLIERIIKGEYNIYLDDYSLEIEVGEFILFVDFEINTKYVEGE